MLFLGTFAVRRRCSRRWKWWAGEQVTRQPSLARRPDYACWRFSTRNLWRLLCSCRCSATAAELNTSTARLVADDVTSRPISSGVDMHPMFIVYAVPAQWWLRLFLIKLISFFTAPYDHNFRSAGHVCERPAQGRCSAMRWSEVKSIGSLCLFVSLFYRRMLNSSFVCTHALRCVNWIF